MELKSLITSYDKLIKEERWDIDYHLPPIEVKKYNTEILKKLEVCADIITDKRNPTLTPQESFIYIDISSIDVETGLIMTPQELMGEEAPSRARKVVKAGDIIISTCRPTRGAIAIIPEEYNNQICSTGFSVIRVKPGYNVCYIHFILRSSMVKEQFRKFSTGSSYPAILDSDVLKTQLPLPIKEKQDIIASKVQKFTSERIEKINIINSKWNSSIEKTFNEIKELKN